MSKLYCTRLHENSRQAKANKFSLVFWLNEIVHRYIPFGALCGRFAKRPEKCPFPIGAYIRNFFPEKPSTPVTNSCIYLFSSGLRVYSWGVKPVTTQHFCAGLFFLSIIPVRPRTLRRIFFAIPKLFVPNSVIFFTICAGKVCYKVCNMYYKVCNMRYKVSNMCYKVCNKNFLIGQEKLSC